MGWKKRRQAVSRDQPMDHSTVKPLLRTFRGLLGSGLVVFIVLVVGLLAVGAAFLLGDGRGHVELSDEGAVAALIQIQVVVVDVAVLGRDHQDQLPLDPVCVKSAIV
jgi:hypothetical protein